MQAHSLISELEKSFENFNSSISNVQKAFGKISHQLDVYRNRENIPRDYLKEMAGNLAHEIRNPLGGISTFVELLSDDEAERSETIQGILEGVQRIDKIVENLIVFSKPVVLHKIKCNFPDVLRKLVQTLRMQLQADEKQIHLIFEHCGTDVLLEVDVQLIQRALMNILNNAVENTPDGGHIRILLNEGNNRQNGVFLSVLDDGCGIADENLNKVFYPFYTTKTYGMGMGLPTTKLIVEKHDGKIDLQKNSLSGVRVNILLPVIRG